MQQVFKLERRTTGINRRTVREEVFYGLTSLAPEEAGPEQLMAHIRGYWGIENGLHYRRDKSLHEDATRMTSPILAEAMAILNNLVIGIILQRGFRYLPQARRHYNAYLDQAISLIFGGVS